MKKAVKASLVVLLAVASVITLVGWYFGFGYSYRKLLSNGVLGRSSQAHELVRRGVQAYRAEEYEVAIGLFQDALRVDPKLRIARMDLANTYAHRYQHTLNPIDLQMGVDQYKDILKDDPRNPEALQGLGSLYVSADREDEGKRYLERSTEAVRVQDRAWSVPAEDEDVPPLPRWKYLFQAEQWRRDIRGEQPAQNNTVQISSPQIRLPYAMVEPNLIHKVRPEYPEMAKIVHVAGDVVLEAVISKSGTITNLQATAGHPILIQSAMEAVRQWRYRPLLLNGKPVDVQTTITIKFPL